VTLATARDGRMGSPQRLENGALSNLADQVDEVWRDLPAHRLRAAVIASVVPKTTHAIREVCERRLGAEPLVLGEDIGIPIEVSVARPESVGIDRLCGAAAAYEEIQAACAVASFGTATTIDCVDDAGRFRGGAILPGLALQARSLHEGTAQLPEVPIATPTEVYGGNTQDAIVNGIVYGAVGALREIVERYATDLGKWPQLVLTGGFAPLIRQTCEFVDALVPDLVLRGMVLAYRRFYATAADE